MAACATLMQTIVALPQAGDRRGRRHGDGGGLSIGRELRSRRRRAPGAFLHAGRGHRPFLHDAGRGVVARVAPKHAMEMLLTGVPIDAEQALRIGLVNRVAPEGARAGALALARHIAQNRRRRSASEKRPFTRSARSCSPKPTIWRARSWSRTCLSPTRSRESPPSWKSGRRGGVDDPAARASLTQIAQRRGGGEGAERHRNEA